MEKRIEYKMIDLGLPSGVKWADRNVGAASPEAYGDYFMWGSTTPDTDNLCDWAHAPFNNGNEKLDEAYFSAHKSEWLTENGTLKPEYDAGTQIMGGSWRMPTSADILELLTGTRSSVEILNSITGIRFISKANGNSVFMPFAGFRCDSYVHFVGNLGYAWSSSLNAGSADGSRSLNFNLGGYADVGDNIRCGGFVVRGVHE